jgi:hypothetical protein
LHALHTPAFAKNAGGQLPHWLALGPKHVVQLASQALQTVLVVEVHVADGYVPAPQTVHAAHAPPLRYLLAAQLVHCVALGPVHAPQLALHAPQLVFAFALQAETWYSLAAQVLQARHWPPLRYLFAAQLVHWLADDPEHVAHAALHAPQALLAAVLHADTSYWLALHVLHVRHCPPLLYLPPTHVLHWLAAGPEQVAHVGSHGSAAAIAGTSSRRTNE